MIHDKTKKYSWEAREIEHKPKSTDWYWALGIAVVAGIILSVIAHNYLFAVVLAFGGFMIGWHANDVPAPVQVEISERGIKLNKDLYPYDTIKAFWMYTDHHDRNRLLIATGRAVMPVRSLSIPDAVPALEVREYLMEFIEEQELKPSAIDLLAESVGL